MNVLVIAAHPDDETLGCGGTILKHRAQGDRVEWMIMTRAISPGWSKSVIRKKKSEVESVSKAYGIHRTHWMEFPAAGLDRIPRDLLVQTVRMVLEKVKPHTVYTVHHGDLHSDHRLTHQSVASALKAVHLNCLGVRRFLTFETLSSTEAIPPFCGFPFVPNLYVDVGQHIEEKVRIMRLYASEIQEDPHPRSPSAIRALARWRGTVVGVQYAEGFCLLRGLE
jgi:LmbE family N-acetylglucosaminyl deacetylase